LAWRWFAWLEEKAEGLEDEAAPARACLSIALDALSAHADDASNSRARDRVRHAMQRDGLTWPLPNVWLGVSAEHQAAADERVPVLLVLPAAVRFVSYEPALGPVDWSAWLSRLDWLICGGESGTKARPMHPAWARSARDQCAAAGTAFFFKQWGQFSPVMREDWIADGRRPHAWVTLDGESGECWLASTDPDSPWLNYTGSPPTGAEAVGRGLVVMAGVGKAAAGRELDGHTHDDYPMARPVHGCDVCPHASLRFNSGDGATTCELLDQQIVAVGRAKPGHRPELCPLLASSADPEPSDG
jgi:protein gp37